MSSTLPRFTGIICFTMDTKGYGFVQFESIRHISGPAFELPEKDLMIHIKDNRGLPEPMPRGFPINFYVRSTLRLRDGVLVFDATLAD